MSPTILPDPRRTPRFAGISTFCRYPTLDEAQKSGGPVDWALYGVPFDSGVTYRPGSRFGPRAVRDASQYVKRFSIHHGLDLCDAFSLADAGDAPVIPYDCKAHLDGVVDFASQLADPSHTKLLAIGGDHSLAYANIKATWLRRGKPAGGLAMLHFDSHLDTVDVTLGEKWSHASPFIRLIEEGCLDPKATLSVGIKGPLNTGADLDYARAHGIRVVTRERFARDGFASIDPFLAELGSGEVYISFDIDCLDPADAPGTGTLSMGGFSATEALGMLRRCAGVNVVGADVVEVLPDRDLGDNTALLAAHVAFEILCLDAVSRRG